MKRLLLLAVLTAVPLPGEEAPSASMREKLRARIVETLPPPPTRPAAEPTEPGEPVLVLKPIVVTESKGVREMEKAMTDDRQRKEAERFTPLKGGRIYGSERLDVGIWWNPGKGWTLLKIKW